MRISDEEHCKQRVYDGTRADFGGHFCGRKAFKDGLCKIHQPEAIKVREERNQRRFEEREERSDFRRWQRAEEKLKEAEKALAGIKRVLDEPNWEIDDFDTLSKIIRAYYGTK